MYATLCETNGEKIESWYYFIKYEGNEEELKKLQTLLDSIDFYIIEELSTFDLDTTHLVSETTAKEMIKVEINSYSFHRKFDGKLKEINFKIKDSHSNEKKICKVFEKIGFGQIENFIDQEDVSEDDLTTPEDSSEESS